MNFVTVNPVSPLVKQVVSHYYFHENTFPSMSYEFAYYPHYKHAITAYLGSDIVYSTGGNEIHESSSKEVKTMFTRLSANYRSVKLKGRFQKVGVVLNPLGINKILSKSEDNTSEVIPDFEFLYHEKWQTLLGEIWSLSVDERIDALDEFLAENIQLAEKDAFEYEILNLLENPDSITASELSSKLNLSERTLRRVFEKRVGFGFSKLKKIARFRKALENHNENPNQNLTELALISQFYDQPDFIKNIKSFSGQKPKAFFNSIDNFGSGTFWRNL